VHPLGRVFGHEGEPDGATRLHADALSFQGVVRIDVGHHLGVFEPEDPLVVTVPAERGGTVGPGVLFAGRVALRPGRIGRQKPVHALDLGPLLGRGGGRRLHPKEEGSAYDRQRFC
jgi:hypothetical protein